MMMLKQVAGTQVLLLFYGYNGIKIPEQSPGQNCSFSFEQQSKQNSNENKIIEQRAK